MGLLGLFKIGFFSSQMSKFLRCKSKFLGGRVVLNKIKKATKDISHLFQPKLLVNHQKHISDLINKSLFITITVASLSLTTVYAENLNSNIETIYHVYLKGERIGTVDNQKVIQSVIDEKIAEAEVKIDNDYELTIGGQITFVPEKVFRPVYDNSGAVKRLNNELSIMAEATEINVNGKPIVYVNSKAEAETILQKLKLEYVSNEDLDHVQTGIDEKNVVVGVGESKIIDVTFSENVTLSTEKVFPQDILSMNDAVELLQKGTLEPEIHEVEKGDILGRIANKYDLTVEQVLSLNPEVTEDTLLQIGDKLNVTEYKPYINVVTKIKGQKIEEVKFPIEYKEDPDMFKGESKVQQKGQNGKKRIEYIVIKENNIEIDKKVIEEEYIKDPVKKIIIKGTKVIPSRGTGDLLWPTYGGVVTSKMGYRWGRMHQGIDIAGVKNRTIRAADNGKVVFAGWDGGYGKKVVINHNNGMTTLYAHLSKISVDVGDTVPRGSKIGVMGTTGNSTGVHLHFEVEKGKDNINPMKFY